MKSLKTFVVAFACVAVIAVVVSGVSVFSQASAPARSFEFTYLTRIPGLPADAEISRIWIPLPQSDPYQAISALKIESPFSYTTHRDSEYGNEYAYLEVPAAKVAGPAEVRVTFQVTRQEHRVALGGNPIAANTGVGAGDLRRFLQPDRRVPLRGVIGELSAQETRGIQDPLVKARAIYDYVIATMRYDKSGTGWGNGDAIWACTAKRGNCTDFHSLFIGMVRAAGIPARFEIGFPLPAEQHVGTIPGYHCWAQFYVEPYGWIPVDASEAWKHPEKKNYFFGAHDDNRLQFSVGRDIRLDPSQQGEPLNYFIYPYAELDGKPLALQSQFSFQDRMSSSD
ncbi:MAG TPA: transglutaminase domain-containing protein [Candidatus Acidoferrum sp.]|nr:transglutaminase domain-containing protein [Candidatus Acidoferrum sp.]